MIILKYTKNYFVNLKCEGFRFFIFLSPANKGDTPKENISKETPKQKLLSTTKGTLSILGKDNFYLFCCEIKYTIFQNIIYLMFAK